MSSARPASRLTGAFLLFVVFSLTLHTTVPASETPPDSKGMSALALALLRLPVVVSMLHIGAHPDDENNALLAYEARDARRAQRICR